MRPIRLLCLGAYFLTRWCVEWLDLTSLMWAAHLPISCAPLLPGGIGGSALRGLFLPSRRLSLSVSSNPNAVTSDPAVPGIDQTFLPIKGSLPTRRSFVASRKTRRRAGEEGRKKSTRPLSTPRYKKNELKTQRCCVFHNAVFIRTR